MNLQQRREIRTSALLHASLQQVWKVWTHPGHLIHWWGPTGFTSTIKVMDFRDEGEWLLTLHGPDGKDYPNRSIFKEIVPEKRIVFEHFNPHFITTVQFGNAEGGTTIEWVLLFDTVEMRDVVAQAHNAEEGQRQNILKLQAYLSALENEEVTSPM